jgi:hypothetical protein
MSFLPKAEMAMRPAYDRVATSNISIPIAPILCNRQLLGALGCSKSRRSR